MITQNYLLYIPATLLFNMYLVHYKNREIISDIFVIFLKVNITTVLVIVSFILCMNVLGLFFFLYFVVALFFMCCTDSLLEISSILISCVHISYFIYDLMSKYDRGVGEYEEDLNLNKEEHSLIKEDLDLNTENHNEIKEDLNLNKEDHNLNKEDHNLIKEDHIVINTDNNFYKKDHNAIKKFNLIKEESIESLCRSDQDSSSTYVVQLEGKLLRKNSIFRLLKIYFKSVYNYRITRISLFDILRCDIEKYILKESINHIYSKIHILAPCLIILCLVFHIQTFIFIHYYPCYIPEKILVYAGYFLFINIYSNLCIEIFRSVIISNKNIRLDTSYKNMIISLVSNVSTYETHISNNINYILILVGYYYMIFVNRICSYYSNHDIIRYSILFYSNTIMFSWIMICISFSVIEVSF